jgi:hypothetical protein
LYAAGPAVKACPRTLFLHVYLASQTLNCRTSTTTSCVVTHHAVFGLVPVGREEIADLACIA